MGRSKLRVALAAEKGTDFKKLREKKKFKAALKEKKSKMASKKGEEEEDDEEEDEEDEEEDDEEDDHESGDEENGESAKDLGTKSQLLAAMQADSDDESDDDVEMEAKIDRKHAKKVVYDPQEEDDEEEEDEEDEDDDENAKVNIEYADIQAATRAATAQRQRRVIKSAAALTAALDRIRAVEDKMAFHLHMSVLGAAPTAAPGSLADPDDDAAREKQLYSQSLQAALVARKRLRAERVPFTRPNDFFAEMVKEDGHMARVKAKLVEAATARKASAEARKQRELKKFGKQVQIEKLQERAKQKRDTLEKIKSLKRKRSEGGATTTHEEGLFDVAVEKELAAPSSKRTAGTAGARSGKPGQPNAKRQQKNSKYGFGGKKKNSKSGDAISSSDFSGFNAKRGGTGGGGGGFKKQRPGKARRQASAGRR